MSLPRALIAALAMALLVPATGLAAGVRIAPRDVPLGAGRTLAGATRLLLPRSAPFRFNLVGLHWQGAGDVWFRVRGANGWDAWRPGRPEADDLPDRGTPERRRRRGWRIGNPYWTDPSRMIQYRVTGRVSRLRTWFLWSETRPKRRRLAAAAAPAVLSRQAWEASEALVRAEPSLAPGVAFAIVHHTAGRSPASPEESAALVRAIQTYHVKANGWNDIGYNFLVDPFGQTFEGRRGGIDRPVVGAHAQGFNTGSVGVAVIGTYERGGITSAAEAALAALLAWRLDLAHVDPITRLSWLSAGNPRFPEGIPVALNAVSGHRDTGFTGCPGDALYGRLAEIAQLVALTGLPKLYEPAVAGAVGGPVQFGGRLSEALPWTVTVSNAAGRAVASGSGLGPEISWSWDATRAPRGTYAYRIDAGPTVLPAVGTIGVPRDADVTEFAPSPAAISPNGDGVADTTSVRFTLTEPAAVTVVLRDSAGRELAALLTERALPAGPAAVAWDGNLPDGTALPDARYRIAVKARFAAKELLRSRAVVVDRSLGALALSPAAVSPNGDGRLDALTLRFDLARPAAARVRILAGVTSVARVFAGSLAGGARQMLVWSGRKRTGRLRDGAYVAVVETTTDLGTRTLAAPFAIDTTPPRATIVSARTRRGATKLVLALSEPVRVKVWYDGSPVAADRPAGTSTLWRRARTTRIRVIAWDAAGNRSRAAVAAVQAGP